MFRPSVSRRGVIGGFAGCHDSSPLAAGAEDVCESILSAFFFVTYNRLVVVLSTEMHENDHLVEYVIHDFRIVLLQAVDLSEQGHLSFLLPS